jgi:dihydroxyacetone kinase
MSKQLFNNPINIVNESIEGLLLSDSRLKKVGDQNILVREDITIYKQKHVTLISGGGSGKNKS